MRPPQARLSVDALEARELLSGNPIAVNDAYTVPAGMTVTMSVLSNDADPRGGTIMLDTVGTPAHGTAVVDAFNPDVIDYTPAAGFTGADSFTYTIRNSAGSYSGIASATVSVTVTASGMSGSGSGGNPLPIAVDDAAMTNPGLPVMVWVLNNDLDPAGDALSVQGVTAPARGTASPNSDGSITYDPNADFTGGSDTFGYTITDGHGGSSSATVTITVGAASGSGSVPGGNNPILGGPAAGNPGMANPGAGNPGMGNPGMGDPGMGNPGAGNPGMGNPGAGNPGLGDPGAGNPGVGDPDVGAPGVSGPGLGSPGIGDPGVGTPGTQNPVPGNPTPGDPGTGNPGTGNPGTGNPGTGNPGTGNPGTGNPGTGNPGSGAPGTGNPGLGSPGDPGTETPGAGGPGAGMPAPGDPGAAGPSPGSGTTAGPCAVDDYASTTTDVPVTIAVLGNDSDPAGNPLSLQTVSTPADGMATIAGATVVYTPAPGYSGQDVFTYTISDGQGGTSSATVTVTVLPTSPAPVANDAQLRTTQGTPLAGVVTASDADNAPLTYSVVSGPSAGTVTLDPVTGAFVYTPVASFYGTDNFTFKVNDGQADSNVATVTITVASYSPPRAIDDSFAILHDQALLAANVTANDADPSGGPLTVRIVQGPVDGTASVNSDGTIDYTPNAGFVGTDTLSYKVNDGQQDSNVANVVISVTDQAPVAGGASFNVVYNQLLTMDLAGSASDADGDPLSVTIVQGPQHGTLQNNGDGTFTYLENAGFTGTDTLTYQVNDGAYDSNVATAAITVTDQAPTAAPAAFNVPAGGALTLDSRQLLRTATVPDGGAVSFLIVDAPAHGQLTDNGDGTYQYVPYTGFVGTDQLTYQLNDGVYDSNVATVTLNVVAKPLVANDDLLVAYADGSALTIQPADLLSNDSGTAGTSLTIAAINGSSYSAGTPVGLPSGGTLLPQADGSFLYTAPAGFTGQDSFTYTVTDGANVATATARLMVGQGPIQGRFFITPDMQNLVLVLYRNLRTWADPAASANVPTVTLFSVNQAVGDFYTQRENAVAAAVLKSYVLQNPADASALGPYANVFGIQTQTLTGADIQRFRNALANNDGAARQLSDIYNSMLEKLNAASRTVLFPNAPIRPQDLAASIRQGRAGDCSFLSSVIGLADQQGLNAFQNRIHTIPQPPGRPTQYDVDLFNDQGQPMASVQISEPTDAERVLYGSTTDGSMWLSILEKAYMTAWTPSPLQPYTNGLYDVAVSGQLADLALRRVTGTATMATPPTRSKTTHFCGGC